MNDLDEPKETGNRRGAGEPAGLREWINRNPVVSGGGALLVAALVLFMLFGSRTPSGPTSDYYDEATGKTSVRSIKDVPPLIGATGEPTLVRAHFTTGADGPRKLIWLEKFTPEAKAVIEQALSGPRTGPPNVPDAERAHLVRRPEPGSPWVPMESPEGRQVTNPGG